MSILYGAFSYYFNDMPLAQSAAAMKKAGYDAVQLSRLTVPYKESTEAVCWEVKAMFDEQGLPITNFFVHGNLSHPDEAVRHAAAEDVKAMCRTVRYLGTNILSLMPGSLDPHDEWAYHPDNDSEEAFDRLVGTVRELAAYAARYDVVLCFEMFFLSVVSTAERMRRFIDSTGPNVRVMYDPGAAVGPDRASDSAKAMKQDFQWLAKDIAVVHVEDIAFTDGVPRYVLPGQGIIHWDTYYCLLQSIDWNGPIHLEINEAIMEQKSEINKAFGIHV